MVEKSLEMIIGMLAILKAGGTYLPIDVDYPVDRISYILKDSEVEILLVDNKLNGNIEFSNLIIDINNENINVEDRSNLININNSKDLAYIIYTSGTTGNPKGVMIDIKMLLGYYLMIKICLILMSMMCGLCSIHIVSIFLFGKCMVRLLNGGS